MTVIPDDSVILLALGIVVLEDLTSVATLTLLHGNDVTVCPVDALTRLQHPSVSGVFIVVFSIAVHTTLLVQAYTTDFTV